MSASNLAQRGFRPRHLLPLILFGAMGVMLAVGLGRDPRLVPSPLLGRSLPEFSLPDLHHPGRRVVDGDLRGQVSLLNVWATWCVACRQEHDMLLRVASEARIPIFGLNYKDQRDNALRWLTQLGDPYVRTAFDAQGRVGLDLGVYGAPETYVIDAAGDIAYKHIGPITAEIWDTVLAPLIRSLQQGRT